MHGLHPISNYIHLYITLRNPFDHHHHHRIVTLIVVVEYIYICAHGKGEKVRMKEKRGREERIVVILILHPQWKIYIYLRILIRVNEIPQFIAEYPPYLSLCLPFFFLASVPSNYHYFCSSLLN